MDYNILGEFTIQNVQLEGLTKTGGELVHQKIPASHRNGLPQYSQNVCPWTGSSFLEVCPLKKYGGDFRKTLAMQSNLSSIPRTHIKSQVL